MSELSPQELRAVTEADYRRSMGLSAEDAHRLAIADLELVDAARRAHDLAETSDKPVAVDPNHERPDVIKQAEQEQGVKLLEKGEGGFERFRLVHADPTSFDESWALCCGRLYRICEGAQQSADYYQATRTCTMPDLALRWLEIMAFFKLRHRQGSKRIVFGIGHSGSADHNPFRNPHTGEVLSNRDAVRKLRRLAEDIADKSSGQLGPWRVPK